jgi:hypothetical protein
MRAWLALCAATLAFTLLLHGLDLDVIDRVVRQALISHNMMIFHVLATFIHTTRQFSHKNRHVIALHLKFQLINPTFRPVGSMALPLAQVLDLRSARQKTAGTSARASRRPRICQHPVLGWSVVVPLSTTSSPSAVRGRHPRDRPQRTQLPTRARRERNYCYYYYYDYYY